jgi:hypothetical protein
MATIAFKVTRFVTKSQHFLGVSVLDCLGWLALLLDWVCGFFVVIEDAGGLLDIACAFSVRSASFLHF